MAMIFNDNLTLNYYKRVGDAPRRIMHFQIMPKQPVETETAKDIRDNVYGFVHLTNLLGELFDILGAYSDSNYRVHGNKISVYAEELDETISKEIARNEGEQIIMFAIPYNVGIEKHGEDWVLSVVEVE